MRASIFISMLATVPALTSASPAPQASQPSPILPVVTAAPGSLGLGAACSSSDQCANGVSCYGVTAYTINRCGGFQATCSSDSQCATNTCNDGFCNGLLASSLYHLGSTPTPSPTSPAGSSVTPSSTTTTALFPSVTAANGTLGLGAVCSFSAQCANGADCYGVTAFTITTCGSFQSSCTSDLQCATNNCNDGFCNGVLASSLFRITTTSTPPSTSTWYSNSTVPTAAGTGGSQTTSTASSAPTQPVAVNGAASNFGRSFVVVVAAVAGLCL